MNLIKNSKLLIVLLSVLLCVTGCEYVPREVHTIKTIDGKVIKLACPVVDAGRSEVTYLIDGECVIYKSDT